MTGMLPAEPLSGTRSVLGLVLHRAELLYRIKRRNLFNMALVQVLGYFMYAISSCVVNEVPMSKLGMMPGTDGW